MRGEKKSKRPSASARGYDAAWRALAARYRAAHPQCEAPGCSAAAAVVDHRIPIRAAPALRLEWSNLISLCAAHHSGAKQRLENRLYPKKRAPRFDIHGRPIK